MYKLEVKDVSISFEGKAALKRVSAGIDRNAVTALIGPTGCGKTTFLKLFNRMNELEPGMTLSGQVLLDGVNLYAPEADPLKIRKKIGIVLKNSAVLPVSIYDNLVFALKLQGVVEPKKVRERAETALYRADLWEDVKDSLNKPAARLPEGLQRRLCIARVLAQEPTALLLDEPTYGLDPASSARIEQLIDRFKQNLTILIVTHNLQQAARLSDSAAYFEDGELIEHSPTKKIFTQPNNPKTKNYLTGRHE